METNLKEQLGLESCSDILDVDEWQLITNAINAYMISEAVYAGCELNLFEKIEGLDSPDVEHIAHAIGLSVYCCSILLLCLCSSKLIYKNKKTGFYFNHPAARKALCANKINTFIPFVRFNHQIQQKGMSYFLEALKTETNAGLAFLSGDATSLYGRLAQSEGMSDLFHAGMAAYTHLGPKIVTFEEMTHCNLLLDVGGGNGSVSRKSLVHYTALNAIVIDIETVCQIGKTLNHDLKDRLQFYAMDIFSSEWLFAHDSILFSHILEIFSLDKVKMLYKKAYDSLPKGGRLFVWTIVANDDETGSLQAAKSSAYFLTMASGEGKAYARQFHLDYCQSIGFVIERIYDRAEYDHLGFVALK